MLYMAPQKDDSSILCFACKYALLLTAKKSIIGIKNDAFIWSKEPMATPGTIQYIIKSKVCAAQMYGLSLPRARRVCMVTENMDSAMMVSIQAPNGQLDFKQLLFLSTANPGIIFMRRTMLRQYLRQETLMCMHDITYETWP